MDSKIIINFLYIALHFLSLFIDQDSIKSIVRSDDEPPLNVILIMVDDMGIECIEAYGGSSYSTPNINKLSETGTRFDFAFAQPMCTPSRVKIMTGKSNVRNYRTFAHIDPNEITFGNLFKNAGYKTCLAGKWQLGGHKVKLPKFGFDNYCLQSLERNNGNKKSQYYNPVISVDGNSVSYKNGEYGPDIVFEYVLNFIEENKDYPFFLYYPMNLIHEPFEVTPNSLNPQLDTTERSKINEEEVDSHEIESNFSQMVEYMDKIVGDLVLKLDELNLRKQTVILFTSDNGTTRGVKSIINDEVAVGRKGSTKNYGTQVPLIVNCPGLVPIQISQDLVDLSDILPTLCDFGQISIPEKISNSLDGISFYPRLLGREGESRQWVHSWYQDYRYSLGLSDENIVWQYVRNKKYKLYSSGKFYNLELDAPESHPLDIEELTKKQDSIKTVFQKVLDYFEKLRPREFYDPDQISGTPN